MAHSRTNAPDPMIPPEAPEVGLVNIILKQQFCFLDHIMCPWHSRGAKGPPSEETCIRGSDISSLESSLEIFGTDTLHNTSDPHRDGVTSAANQFSATNQIMILALSDQ